MAEREGSENLSGSEQIKQELFDYLKDAELGTARHLAAYHIVEDHRLHTERREFIQSLTSAESEEGRYHFNAMVLRTVMEEALLNREMNNRKATMPGYREANQFIREHFDDLGDAASSEARVKFPDDESERTYEFNRIYYSAWSRLQDDIYLGRTDEQIKE